LIILSCFITMETIPIDSKTTIREVINKDL
jgi:hypothetical protein